MSPVMRRRVALGLTQAQVADHLGVCRETVSRVERRAQYTSRRDARVLRLRARLNDFYLSVERGKRVL
jgi:transcriptional regulator